MDHPPWLDDTEMRIWLAFVEASGRVISQLNETVKARSGLRFEDYEVLVHLSEAAERRLRMTELSKKCLHSQARLSQRINRLSAAGLVTREKCPEDRRGTFAVLTDQGWELMVSLAPVHVADVRRRLIDLIEPDEREVVARVLERVAQRARDGAAA